MILSVITIHSFIPCVAQMQQIPVSSWLLLLTGEFETYLSQYAFMTLYLIYDEDNMRFEDAEKYFVT